MSLSPKDMDFIEARHVAAREIALALGVPPMLLGIPGDNTYSNLAEAQRIFWRQTVLPLVNRTATALSNWLAPAYDTNLRFAADIDAIEALSPERETLWARLEKTSFLTEDEKRTAIGYGPKPTTNRNKFLSTTRTHKFNPHHDELGRFTTADGGNYENTSERVTNNPLLHQANNKKGGLPKSVWNFTVRQFASKYCKGTINRELPGQFDDMTIADIIDMANMPVPLVQAGAARWVAWNRRCGFI